MFSPLRCSARGLLQPLSVLLVFGSPYIHLFVFCIGKACRCLLRSGDWHRCWRISHFFGVRNSWIAFAVSLWFLAICTVKHCLRLNLSRKFSSVHFPIRPATSINSQIISQHQWPNSFVVLHAHTITLPALCLTADVVCFRLWVVSFLIILVEVYFVFMCPKNYFLNCAGCLRCFLGFLLLILKSGLHLVGRPSIFPFMKASHDCRRSYETMLWNCFSKPWK